MHIPTINEASTFYADPDAEGAAYDRLSEALKAAAAIPVNQRHPRATIVTQSGATYGWDAIEDLRKHVLD